jgi:hypothetical protein
MTREIISREFAEADSSDFCWSLFDFLRSANGLSTMVPGYSDGFFA